jgi:histidinol phosphatase-like PHP family hydrolase
VIDLHTHTFFSDGILIPSELVYSAKFKGYSAIAITDHVDFSNMDFVIPRIVKAVPMLSEYFEITVLAGAEISYLPPKLIKKAAQECRKLGAQIVVVHGETAAENTPPQTNINALDSDIDILAHPGHLTKEQAEIAAASDIKIEISARISHGATNKQVAQSALAAGAKLILNSDTHVPEHLLTKELIEKTLDKAGLAADYYEVMQKNALEVISKYKN